MVERFPLTPAPRQAAGSTGLSVKDRESLLCDIRVFVPLIGAQRIERTDTENADYGTEDVGLLEVEINQLLGLFFNEVDGIPDVCDG